MDEIEKEKLRQLISRTDMSGNKKVDWLVNFIIEREKALQTTQVELTSNPKYCTMKRLCDDRFCLKGDMCNYDEREYE